MDLKGLNKFGASLAPADQKKFHELLNILGSIEDFAEKVRELNREYYKIYKECSNIICFKIGAKTNWSGKKINQIYNVPFMKICTEYDSISEDIQIKFKKWKKSRDYCTEIFGIIGKKGKNDKVVKGIRLLLDDNIKQLSEMEEYYDKIIIMHDKMKGFKKELAVFIN